MKTVTEAEFFTNRKLLRQLTLGEELGVTVRGRTKFIVTKPRPRMTRAQAERRAIGNPDGPKVDCLAFLKTLK